MSRNLITLAILALLVSACGGGGGGSEPSPSPGPTDPTPPAAVTSVTATATDGGATITWTAVSDATNYTVFASTSPSDTSSAISVTTNQTSANLTGLTNGTLYYISVRAENSAGNAPLSSESVVTPTGGGNLLGWSEQTLINIPYDFFGQDNYLGGVAINDAGVAAATWIYSGSTDGNNFVLVNHTATGDWGTEVILAPDDNSTPVVAVTPSGVIVAAWVRHFLDGNNFRTGSTIESRRYEGGTWSSVETIANITTGGSGYAGAIALAADGEGNVLASWWQNQSTLWVNRFDGTAWDTPEQISQSVRNLYPPAIGANSADDAIVVWLQDTEPNDSGQSAGGPSRPTVYGSHYDGSGWSVASLIGHTDLVDFDGAERIRIDVNPLGSAAVAWQQTRNNDSGTGFRIDGLRYDAVTETWSAPETILARDWQTSWPDVAIDANGNAIASWQPTDLADNSSSRLLRASLFDAGNMTWGAAATVNIDDGVTEPSPLFIEMREAGDVFAVWKQLDGVFGAAMMQPIVAGIISNSLA